MKEKMSSNAVKRAKDLGASLVVKLCQEHDSLLTTSNQLFSRKSASLDGTIITNASLYLVTNCKDCVKFHATGGKLKKRTK